MSSTVIKINHVNKRQQRVLAITNLHVLNIASPTSLLPNRIKRKIPLTHILGITTSRFGSEVVIHVDKEDDYRFFTHNLKVKYIEVIVTAISKALHQPTQVFYYDDLSLEQFTTTVVDIDKKVRKTSRCVPVLLDEEKLKVYVRRFRKTRCRSLSQCCCSGGATTSACRSSNSSR
jgi:hypothetical protein